MNELIERAVDALESIATSLSDSNQTDIGIFWTNLALVIATIAFGAYSILSSETRVKDSEKRQEMRFIKQAEQQELEHFERVRPWIVIGKAEAYQVIFENGKGMSWKEYSQLRDPVQIPITINIFIPYTNTGSRVAKNLKQIAMRGNSPTMTKEVLSKQKETDTKMDFGPNQESYYSAPIPWEKWKMRGGKPYYLGLQISYHNGKDVSKSGTIFKATSASIDIVEAWYE